MRKYAYWRTLPHIQKNNRPVFVTSSTCRRWVLPESVRQLVLDCCVHEHNNTIDLHAAVVMPDHIHLIFTPLVGPDDWTYTLPQIMGAIKGRAARKVNVFLNRHGPVWQDESFDHVLRSNESLAEKMDYVCQNPVRAGLVDREQDYRWLWQGKVPML